jgi:hypothetical protein
MNINYTLNVVEEFLDIMYPNFCNDYDYENNESELWKICEEFFQQIGPQI